MLQTYQMKNISKNITYQTIILQLHQVHFKLGSQTRGIKLNWATQANKLNHL